MNHFNSQSNLYGQEFEREIVQCIEDKLHLSGKSNSNLLNPQSENSSTSKKEMFKDLHLISEIQGEKSSRNNSSRDKSMYTASHFSSETSNIEKATVGNKSILTENIPLKSNKTTLRVRDLPCERKDQEDVKRDFKCFNEDDIVQFKGIKPMKLSYNLVKGDDDEDSEEEDINNGKRFLQLHLEKALMDAVKPTKRFYH